MQNDLSDAHRETLSFSFEGLSERDQTLFKSFVRLLAHRTHQNWCHRAQGGDLRVFGPEARTAPAAGECALRVGTAADGTDHFVKLPIHADALETELNRLGDRLAAHGVRKPAVTLQLSDLLHLMRWPSPELLDCHDRIRLAAMMTGRPVTLADVQRRSGVAPDACREFAVAALGAGILERIQGAPGPAMHTLNQRVGNAVQGGLISRIRARLGIGFGHGVGT